jgi:hypothetical protein
MIIPLARISRLTQVIYIEERSASCRFEVSLDPTGRCSVRRGRGTYWSCPIAAVEAGMAAPLVLLFGWPAATAGLLLAYWPLRAVGWVPTGPCGRLAGCLLEPAGGLLTCSYCGPAADLHRCRPAGAPYPSAGLRAADTDSHRLSWVIAIPANQSAALLGLARGACWNQLAGVASCPCGRLAGCLLEPAGGGCLLPLRAVGGVPAGTSWRAGQ